MRDLTPDSMKCSLLTCPSVHELDDGRLLIVGKRDGGAAWARDIAVGEDERAVIIDRALLANVLPQHLHFPPPKQVPNLPPSTLFPSNPKAPDNPYEPFDGNYRDPQVMGDVR